MAIHLELERSYNDDTFSESSYYCNSEIDRIARHCLGLTEHKPLNAQSSDPPTAPDCFIEFIDSFHDHSINDIRIQFQQLLDNYIVVWNDRGEKRKRTQDDFGGPALPSLSNGDIEAHELPSSQHPAPSDSNIISDAQQKDPSADNRDESKFSHLSKMHDDFGGPALPSLSNSDIEAHELPSSQHPAPSDSNIIFDTQQKDSIPFITITRRLSLPVSLDAVLNVNPKSFAGNVPGYTEDFEGNLNTPSVPSSKTPTKNRDEPMLSRMSTNPAQPTIITVKQQQRDAKLARIVARCLQPRPPKFEPTEFSRIRFEIPTPELLHFKGTIEHVKIIRIICKRLKINRKVVMISRLGRSIGELYVARKNYAAVFNTLCAHNMRTIGPDPTLIPRHGREWKSIEEKVVTRLQYLYQRTELPRLQQCILQGYPEHVQAQVCRIEPLRKQCKKEEHTLSRSLEQTEYELRTNQQLEHGVPEMDSDGNGYAAACL